MRAINPSIHLCAPIAGGAHSSRSLDCCRSSDAFEAASVVGFVTSTVALSACPRKKVSGTADASSSALRPCKLVGTTPLCHSRALSSAPPLISALRGHPQRIAIRPPWSKRSTQDLRGSRCLCVCFTSLSRSVAFPACSSMHAKRSVHPRRTTVHMRLKVASLKFVLG